MKKGLLFRTLFVLCFTISMLNVSEVFAQEDWENTQGQECTSIMVGRKASVDGSVITSHTCDGVSHNWISIEPAANHKKGDTQKVYYGTRWTYFRDDTTGLKLKGEIPQVPHTYAYLNTGYPSLNEKQLAIGESTFTGPKELINEKAMFMVEELARIALQRCDNARSACKLMGELAEKYGYADGGEILTVADKNEVWDFEIIGCGKDKIGALWVAQRVPDDHIAIVANIPRIGKLQRNNPDFTKWIKDLNVRPETIKLPEENIGKTLSDINHSRILCDPPPRVMEIKAKINKWDLIKLKSFCTTKETIPIV